MEPFSRIIEQSNAAGVGFLMVELDAGLTFLDVANTAIYPETATRNRENAHLAYKTIVRYSGRVTLVGKDKIDFEQKFTRLKNRLEEAGYPV